MKTSNHLTRVSQRLLLCGVSAFLLSSAPVMAQQRTGLRAKLAVHVALSKSGVNRALRSRHLSKAKMIPIIKQLKQETLRLMSKSTHIRQSGETISFYRNNRLLGRLSRTLKKDQVSGRGGLATVGERRTARLEIVGGAVVGFGLKTGIRHGGMIAKATLDARNGKKATEVTERHEAIRGVPGASSVWRNTLQGIFKQGLKEARYQVRKGEVLPR